MAYTVITEWRIIGPSITEYQELPRETYRWRWWASLSVVNGLFRTPMGWVFMRSRLEKS